MYQMEATSGQREQQQEEVRGGGGERVPAAAYTKVDVSMTASSSSNYYTPHQEQQGVASGASAGQGIGAVPWGDIGPRPEVEKPYDLSALLGHDPGSADAPWRPPPPPASTISAAAAVVPAVSVVADKSSGLSPDAPPFAPASGGGVGEAVVGGAEPASATAAVEAVAAEVGQAAMVDSV
jgi:hypothetical protein